jgi:hypothetical protein
MFGSFGFKGVPETNKQKVMRLSRGSLVMLVDFSKKFFKIFILEGIH